MLEVITTWSVEFDRRSLQDIKDAGGTGIRLIAKGLPPNLLRQIADEILNVSNLKLMLDLPGAKPRLSRALGSISVTEGDFIKFGDSVQGPEQGLVPTEFLELYIEYVRQGHRLLIADGTICFVVEDVDDGRLLCRALHTCVLSGGRSFNLPDSQVAYKAFTDADVLSLEAIAELKIDSLAISMVSSAAEVEDVKANMATLGIDCPVYSKIETAQGLKNLPTITRLSDGIMVARGDLSVEMPLEALAASQSRIIEAAAGSEKKIIVATGILSSLATNKQPTIAEISELGFLFKSGIRSFLLGDVVATNSSARACEWLVRVFSNWAETQVSVSSW